MSNLSKRASIEVLPPLPRLDLRLSFCNREEEALRRKIQTISERRAVAVFFERNGCLHCGGRTLPHAGNALCTKCRRHIYYELDKIEKEIKRGEIR
jgi:predicted class III extradiol MEMO1 family dioxygenase